VRASARWFGVPAVARQPGSDPTNQMKRRARRAHLVAPRRRRCCNESEAHSNARRSAAAMEPGCVFLRRRSRRLRRHCREFRWQDCACCIRSLLAMQPAAVRPKPRARTERACSRTPDTPATIRSSGPRGEPPRGERTSSFENASWYRARAPMTTHNSTQPCSSSWIHFSPRPGSKSAPEMVRKRVPENSPR